MSAGKAAGVTNGSGSGAATAVRPSGPTPSSAMSSGHKAAATGKKRTADEATSAPGPPAAAADEGKDFMKRVKRRLNDEARYAEFRAEAKKALKAVTASAKAMGSSEQPAQCKAVVAALRQLRQLMSTPELVSLQADLGPFLPHEIQAEWRRMLPPAARLAELCASGLG